MDAAFFVKSFAALFAIMNPIANLPVFLSLVDDRPVAEQRSIAIVCAIALAVSGAIVLTAGQQILAFFSIGIDSFRLAGGLLILLIALHMVNGSQAPSHHGSEAEISALDKQPSPAVYPLTIPLLMGPGTISTLIVFEHQASGLAQQTALWAALGATIALLATAFFASSSLKRFLGQSTTSVMSRVMGMILAAIAVEMMAAGAKSLFPGLAGGAS